MTAMLEPLNTAVDHSGQFLTRAEDAFNIVKQVDSPYVKVLYDIYHQQITEGNLLATITEHIADIAHFHGAGVPGRHELDCGELSYVSICREIDKLGYDGYLGLEYFPQEDVMIGIRNAVDRLQ